MKKKIYIKKSEKNDQINQFFKLLLEKNYSLQPTDTTENFRCKLDSLIDRGGKW